MFKKTPMDIFFKNHQKLWPSEAGMIFRATNRAFWYSKEFNTPYQGYGHNLLTLLEFGKHLSPDVHPSTFSILRFICRAFFKNSRKIEIWSSKVKGSQGQRSSF